MRFVLATESGLDFAKVMKNGDVSRIETKCFKDNEICLKIPFDVDGKNIVLVTRLQNYGDFSVNDRIVELLLVLRSLRKAKSITAVIPYLPYSRGDKEFEPGMCISADALARVFRSFRVKSIITADVHSPLVENMYDSFIDINAQDLFIRNLPTGAAVIAPDAGSLPKAEEFAGRMKAELIVLKKYRPKAQVAEIRDISGDPAGKDLVIFDDMIDTASTMVAVVNYLKAFKPKSITICATHAILSDPGTKRMAELDVEVISSNTIQKSDEYLHNNPWLKQLDIAQLFAKVLK